MGGHFGFVSFDWSGVTVLGLYIFFPISLILPKDKKEKIMSLIKRLNFKLLSSKIMHKK